MHVAMDGVGNHVGGGWSVLVRTAANLVADPRIERLTIFCSPLDLVASPAPIHPKITWVERHREHRSPRARLAWFSIGLDSQVDRIEADVVLTLNGVGRTSCPRVCLVQQAFTVWGKLARVRPRRFAAKLALLRRETAKSVAAAQAVVVQTGWMRDRVRDRLTADAHVVPLGLPMPREPHGGTPRSRHRIAFIGADLPYKRREVASEAVRLAQKRIPDLELHFVDELRPSRVMDALCEARALLVTSDVESFCLPIVEAFAARCPVVCTDRAWAKAVAGDAAAYFDHGRATAAARRIVDGLHQPARLDELAERGVQRFAAIWETDPYARLVDLFEEVA